MKIPISSCKIICYTETSSGQDSVAARYFAEQKQTKPAAHQVQTCVPDMDVVEMEIKQAQGFIEIQECHDYLNTKTQAVTYSMLVKLESLLHHGSSAQMLKMVYGPQMVLTMTQMSQGRVKL